MESSNNTDSPIKVLLIIRGVSGSGKTTTANSLALGYATLGKNVSGPFEADQFMMEDGEYKFEPSRLGECHQKCFDCCERAMERGADIIIQSNTNTQKKEYQRYIDSAAKWGYKVTEITVKGDFGNTHGVPEKTVRRQRERFEH